MYYWFIFLLGDPPVLAPFTGSSRLKVEMDSTDPIDFFKLFVDDAFISRVTTETNIYGHTKSMGPLSVHSRMKKWEPMTDCEMKVFLAIIITVGLVYKSNLEDYWITDFTTETPFFGKTMPKDRFVINSLYFL